jgi:uncharacterized protein YbjT (DUF2867 family)
MALMTEPVLILGATGTQGGAVARALLDSGRAVNALVRSAASERARALADRGARLVEGDLHDRKSLARAFGDVAAAYAITTPFELGAQDEERQGDAILAAAADAGLQWLILASVASADHAAVPHFQSKAQIEARLRESDLDWTVIAPSYFYENVLGSRPAIQQGRLPLALSPDRPLHQVALADLGATVQAVLASREEHLGRRIEVAGDAPTPAQMARAIGVRYEQIALSQIRKRSPDLAAMYEFLELEGYGIDVTALRAQYPEVNWISFEDWAQTIDWEHG